MHIAWPPVSDGPRSPEDSGVVMGSRSPTSCPPPRGGNLRYPGLLSQLYSKRKIYIPPPISERLCGKLPVRRALICSKYSGCEQGLLLSTSPGMEEKKKWICQVRPKANGIWFSPINSSRSKGHLLHQIPATFTVYFMKHPPLSS